MNLLMPNEPPTAATVLSTVARIMVQTYRHVIQLVNRVVVACLEPGRDEDRFLHALLGGGWRRSDATALRTSQGDGLRRRRDSDRPRHPRRLRSTGASPRCDRSR